MSDKAQICVIQIFDVDGENSLTVSHTVAETVKIERYGVTVADLDYDEARALAKALRMVWEDAEHNKQEAQEARK